MSKTNYEQFRSLIADESLPLTERRTAAEHYITALVDAVPEPGDDHAEVIELRTPWKSDRLGSIAETAWKARNGAYGWYANGPTVSQARAHVHKRLKLLVLLAVVVDEHAHHLERLAACQSLLEDHRHPQNFYRKNGYHAEKLLSKVLPATAHKWTAKGKVPVERPPREFADVWEN